MNNTAITMVDQTPKQMDPYTPRTFEGAWELAQIIVKSRMNGSIQTPEAAFMVMALGSDMGLSVSQSLRGIQIIEGKACPTADCLVACVIRSGLAEYIVEIETTEDHSTWETQRKGEKVPRRSTFTIDDAKRALLTSRGKDPATNNWSKYPKRMLAARAKAFLVRDVYPDLALGLYIPDEIQAEEPSVRDVARSIVVDLLDSVDEPIDARFHDSDAEPTWVTALGECTTEDQLKATARQAVNEGANAGQVKEVFASMLAGMAGKK